MNTEAKKPFLSERDVYAYQGCDDNSVMPIHEMQRLYEAELERVNLAWKTAFDLGHDWQEKAKEHEKTISDLTVRLVAQQKEDVLETLMAQLCLEFTGKKLIVDPYGLFYQDEHTITVGSRGNMLLAVHEIGHFFEASDEQVSKINLGLPMSDEPDTKENFVREIVARRVSKVLFEPIMSKLLRDDEEHMSYCSYLLNDIFAFQEHELTYSGENIEPTRCAVLRGLSRTGKTLSSAKRTLDEIQYGMIASC